MNDLDPRHVDAARQALQHRTDPAARAALARIRAGTFGLCVQCGDALASESLAARPTLALCAVCLAELKAERAGERFGVCGVTPTERR